MKDKSIKLIAFNGVLAALYVVLTLISYPISFLMIQFRVAEILLVIVFFKKDSIIGLTIGTFLANLFSSIGMWDCLFGTLATLISCLLIMLCKHLLFVIFIPTLINAFAIGLELNLIMKEPFWVSFGFVALGEIVVLTIAYFICLILKKKGVIKKYLPNSSNLDFKF